MTGGRVSLHLRRVNTCDRFILPCSICIKNVQYFSLQVSLLFNPSDAARPLPCRGCRKLEEGENKMQTASFLWPVWRRTNGQYVWRTSGTFQTVIKIIWCVGCTTESVLWGDFSGAWTRPRTHRHTHWWRNVATCSRVPSVSTDHVYMQPRCILGTFTGVLTVVHLWSHHQCAFKCIVKTLLAIRSSFVWWKAAWPDNHKGATKKRNSLQHVCCFQASSVTLRTSAKCYLL